MRTKSKRYSAACRELTFFNVIKFAIQKVYSIFVMLSKRNKR